MITYRFIFGGIEKLLLNIFENKSNPSIHYDLLTLIAETDNELIEKIKSLGVGYYSLELDKHSTLERQFYHYKALYKFIKQNHYDVVHINITSYARALDMVIVKLAGVKTRIIHSHSADEILPFSRKILRPMRKLYDFSATDFFACSDSAAQHLFSSDVFITKKYIVVNNGIEVKNYLFSSIDRDRIRHSLGIKKDTLLFGHVGRLTEAKNHLFLLKIISEVSKLKPNSKLLLVGDGELKNEIEKEINNLGIKNNVIMYGASSNIPALLSSMDVFLFPSKWEGLGISVVEAQCNGLPCYVSENVPQTAVLTSNVYRFSTLKGARWWAREILSKVNKRVDETNKIVQAGYDITCTVQQLENIYVRNRKSL